MRTMQEWLDAYGESHQNKTNKLIHWICVPVIFFNVIGLLASIPNDIFTSILGDGHFLSPYMHFGTVVIILGGIFYLRLSFKMFIGILIWSLFCLWGNEQLSQLNIGGNVIPLWQSSLVLFVLAWIGQFIGHKIEGEKPSFFEDLQFLMIGPAWLIAFIYKKIGISY